MYPTCEEEDEADAARAATKSRYLFMSAHSTLALVLGARIDRSLLRFLRHSVLSTSYSYIHAEVRVYQASPPIDPSCIDAKAELARQQARSSASYSVPNIDFDWTVDYNVLSMLTC